MILQVQFHFTDQFVIVWTIFVQPEYGWSIGLARTIHGELYPVTNRRVLGLAHAPDIAFFDILLDQYLAFIIDDTRYTVGGYSEIPIFCVYVGESLSVEEIRE